MTVANGVEQTRWVAGVDGCPAGWFVALVNVDDLGEACCEVCITFEDVLKLKPAPEIIAVDMPIGVPDVSIKGGRVSDNEARSRLGGRQSSVFAVPSRAALAENDYRRACAVNLDHSEPPRKVSKQCFMLFAKMREVDKIMTPELQDRVFEVHPELAFWALNGEAPLDLPKKVKSRPDVEGLDLRKSLLVNAGFLKPDLENSRWPKSAVGPDDIIDAFAAAWSARRLLHGEAVTLPSRPPRDGCGLRMEINA